MDERAGRVTFKVSVSSGISALPAIMGLGNTADFGVEASIVFSGLQSTGDLKRGAFAYGMRLKVSTTLQKAGACWWLAPMMVALGRPTAGFKTMMERDLGWRVMLGDDRGEGLRIEAYIS